jgi:hypothetical protein
MVRVSWEGVNHRELKDVSLRCYTVPTRRGCRVPFIRSIGRLVVGKAPGVADSKSFRGGGCGWCFRLNE